MATFVQRGRRWKAQVKDKGKTRSKTFATKALAAAWAREQETLRDKGITPPRTDVTVADLWPAYLARREGVVAPSTLAKNRTHWRVHVEPAFGSHKVVTLRRSTVETWVAQATRDGVGTPTVEACVRLLSGLLDVAVDDEVVPANPARRVRLPRHLPERRRFVTEAEVDAVLDAIAEPTDRLLIALLAGTGLRIGEALGLTRAAVTPTTVEVRQVWTRRGMKPTPKSESSARVVPVPTTLREPLAEHVSLMLPTALLFPHRDDRNVAQRVLLPACEAAGVEPFTTHALRHHAASRWVAGGLPLFEVARALGHRDTRMVERVYGHLTPGAHDRLLAVMDGTRQAP